MKKHHFLILLALPLSLFAQDEVSTDDELVKTIYYNDSIPAIVRWYGGDKKLDSLKTYYKSGELEESFYFSNDRYDEGSYNFNRIAQQKSTFYC